MQLCWDEEKRQTTLRERKLDFADCERIFAGTTHEYRDRRKDYGEARWNAIGFLENTLVQFAFVERGPWTRIISMRRATGQERRKYEKAIMG
jgi:uncharacterized DUF497 family protein